MDVRVGLWRKLSAEELMLLNCVVLEKTLESPLDCKEIQPVHSKGDQPWVFFGRNDAKAETPVLWPPHAKSWLTGKRLWCWEGLGAGGEGDDRGWYGWMASLTRWMWVWVNSRSWWWTGRPGVLQFKGSQRVGNDWVTELNWTECVYFVLNKPIVKGHFEITREEYTHRIFDCVKQSINLLSTIIVLWLFLGPYLAELHKEVFRGKMRKYLVLAYRNSYICK